MKFLDGWLQDGDLEYSGSGLPGLFAQRRNLLRPRFWSMLADLLRFYRKATTDADLFHDTQITLRDYLAAGGYGAAFRDNHLLPLAAAIWSASPIDILSFPAAAFVRFNHNHGLLKLRKPPDWQTVVGGSVNYVKRLIRPFADRIKLDTAVQRIRRAIEGVIVTDLIGGTEHFDRVVIASHADQALAMLADPSPNERELLGAFRYSHNLAVLHSDSDLMPKRRAVWSSWNFRVRIRHSGGKFALPIG